MVKFVPSPTRVGPWGQVWFYEGEKSVFLAQGRVVSLSHLEGEPQLDVPSQVGVVETARGIDKLSLEPIRLETKDGPVTFFFRRDPSGEHPVFQVEGPSSIYTSRLLSQDGVNYEVVSVGDDGGKSGVTYLYNYSTGKYAQVAVHFLTELMTETPSITSQGSFLIPGIEEPLKVEPSEYHVGLMGVTEGQIHPLPAWTSVPGSGDLEVITHPLWEEIDSSVYSRVPFENYIGILSRILEAVRKPAYKNERRVAISMANLFMGGEAAVRRAAGSPPGELTPEDYIFVLEQTIKEGQAKLGKTGEAPGNATLGADWLVTRTPLWAFIQRLDDDEIEGPARVRKFNQLAYIVAKSTDSAQVEDARKALRLLSGGLAGVARRAGLAENQTILTNENYVRAALRMAAEAQAAAYENSVQRGLERTLSPIPRLQWRGLEDILAKAQDPSWKQAAMDLIKFRMGGEQGVRSALALDSRRELSLGDYLELARRKAREIGGAGCSFQDLRIKRS